jgi:hypothetical protein
VQPHLSNGNSHHHPECYRDSNLLYSVLQNSRDIVKYRRGRKTPAISLGIILRFTSLQMGVLELIALQCTVSNLVVLTQVQAAAHVEVMVALLFLHSKNCTDFDKSLLVTCHTQKPTENVQIWSIPIQYKSCLF